RVRRAGWDIVLEPEVTVVHRRGASGASVPGWRLRVAMAGDAYAVRKHRGWAYLGGFAVARVVGLLAEGVLQGILGGAPGQEVRRRRSRYAFQALGAWLSALAAGGAVRPSAPAFLPPPRRERLP
ncbi:MAG TPA: hypothetical protein VJ997_01010, partial [Longimicrobiales bacterium]|nr:hypothetical protein [Longimicrobiales bacterium]